MRKFALIYFLLCYQVAFCFKYPEVNIIFPNPPPNTVFKGETLRIPVIVRYWHLRDIEEWYPPVASSLEAMSTGCSGIPIGRSSIEEGVCKMNLVIPGNVMNATISGKIRYRVYGSTSKDRHTWDRVFESDYLSVTVIPHALSMFPIPVQKATANQSFVMNLKRYVAYYDENVTAGKPAQPVVYPTSQDGLYFDKDSFSIVGTPNRLGTYHFKVGVQNVNGSAKSTDLIIEVESNPKDKPVFKKTPSIPSAQLMQGYHMNLLDLLESKKEFMLSNQISFKIKPNQNNPEWLYLVSDDTTQLMGNVPEHVDGQEVSLVIIASSNTGGDSEPLTLKIPIAYDPLKKPKIGYFEMEYDVETEIREDLFKYVDDPVRDKNLKLIIDKIEPIANWLNISSYNPTVLEGLIPEEVTGQKFNITLRATTAAGGTSDPIIIPLQVKVRKDKTPRFKVDNPILPMLHAGEPYFYDFTANRDIFPDFEEAPYFIAFAENISHPEWLRIENNQLHADLVPNDLESVIPLSLKIRNIPGGQSEVITIFLR
ncbi:MAG TPA: hypothetical protein PK657_00480 [Legionella sp.]|nr:hypothetical protein [Legionella sp.]